MSQQCCNLPQLGLSLSGTPRPSCFSPSLLLLPLCAWGKWEGWSQREAKTQPAARWQGERGRGLSGDKELKERLLGRAEGQRACRWERESGWKESLVVLCPPNCQRLLSTSECEPQHWCRSQRKGWTTTQRQEIKKVVKGIKEASRRNLRTAGTVGPSCDTRGFLFHIASRGRRRACPCAAEAVPNTQ